MSVVDLPSSSPAGDDMPTVGPGPQERAWRAAEAAAAEAMGTVNPAVARLVTALVDLLAADGWQGAGIRSPEHWVTWKAGVAHSRAAGLELGTVVPDHVARYMCCDARVQVMTYLHGRLVGINPAERTVNRATRRYLTRRDQGCTHPLCAQKLWLHAHHIQFWENGGETRPDNLTLLCPFHHRALHAGEFTIEGDPEAGTLRFLDRWGNPITPPDPRPPDDPPGFDPPRDGPSPPFVPPLAERLQSDWFTWN